ADDARRALDLADAGHDPGARRLVAVQPVRSERTELEERRARVEQQVDPLADGQLAPLAVPRDGLVVAARATLRHGRRSRAELLDEDGHALDVRPFVLAVRVETGAQDRHAA